MLTLRLFALGHENPTLSAIGGALCAGETEAYAPLYDLLQEENLLVNDFSDLIAKGDKIMVNNVTQLITGEVVKFGTICGLPFVVLKDAERVETLGSYAQAIPNAKGQEMEALRSKKRNWTLVSLSANSIITPWGD